MQNSCMKDSEACLHFSFSIRFVVGYRHHSKSFRNQSSTSTGHYLNFFGSTVRNADKSPLFQTGAPSEGDCSII
jgi:hypothetical protein